MRKVFKAIAVISMVLVLSAPALATQSFTWTLRNDNMRDARPVASLAQAAQRFKNTSCIIQGKNRSADVKKVVKLISMALSKGTEVEVIAEGPQEKECIQAVKAVFEKNF